MTFMKEGTPMEKAFTFLGLLIALLPEEEFTADASRWASAILGLKSKYGSEYPHLFRYLHFRNVPRSDSYSPEVSNFLAFLQFADGTVVLNPGFTKMQLQENARKLILERYEESLSPEDISTIKLMGEEILPKIKV